MKQVHLILFISLTISSIQAQESWVSNVYSFGTPTLFVEEVCGDTIIGARTYEKIYVSSSGVTQLEGARRIQGDTVFSLNFSSGQETILYDYSLQVGDSIRLNPGTYKVIDVTASNRKQLTLEDTRFGFQDVWIQGIGSTVSNYLSPGNWASVDDIEIEFVCHYNATTGEQFGGSCVLNPEDYYCQTTSSHHSLDSPRVGLYPNPANTYLTIDLSDSQLVNPTYGIYDSSGQLITISTLTSPISRFSTEFLVPGLYLLEVKGDNQRSVHRLLID